MCKVTSEGVVPCKNAIVQKAGLPIYAPHGIVGERCHLSDPFSFSLVKSHFICVLPDYSYKRTRDKVMYLGETL